MHAGERWVCPTCNDSRDTRYCPRCGEQRLDPHDLTLRGFLALALRSWVDVDGRSMQTLRALIARPGALTVAHLRGQRRPYLGPFQVFLIANVLFFAAQSLTGVNVFSTPLDSHLHGQMWSDAVREPVARRLDAMQTTEQAYAPVFDHAVIGNAKSLVALMVLPFALLLPVLFAGRALPFVAHAVFALHVYAFLLALFCGSVAAATLDVTLGGAGLASPRVDAVLSMINLLLCAIYLFVAIGAVYGARGAARVVKTAALTVAVAGIVLGYRSRCCGSPCTAPRRVDAPARPIAARGLARPWGDSG